MAAKAVVRRRGRPPIPLPSDDDKWVSLNMRVPESFHQRLRLFAARQGRGVNMTQIVIEATKKLLDKQGG